MWQPSTKYFPMQDSVILENVLEKTEKVEISVTFLVCNEQAISQVQQFRGTAIGCSARGRSSSTAHADNFFSKDTANAIYPTTAFYRESYCKCTKQN